MDSGASTLIGAVAADESRTGRRLDIVHTYHRWYDHFPTASERRLADAGHLLLINWEPTDRGGAAMSWASIASGKHDQQIKALAIALKNLAKPVLLSFSHEPEADYAAHGGSASAFAAAFRRVHDLVRAGGVSTVRWVWNTMGLADPVWRSRYHQLYPGDSYVDWIAWDPYNWGSCRNHPWLDFAATVSPFYQWLQHNGFADKPYLLAEFGSVERAGDPAGKADWLAGMPAALARLPALRAVVYFDLPAPPANCDWRTNSTAAAAAGYRRAAGAATFRASSRLSPVG